MSPGSLFDDFTPHARVVTAVAPFVVAIVLRLLLGKNRLTRWLVTFTTMWFAINVLAAPYSVGMRQDLIRLGAMLR